LIVGDETALARQLKVPVPFVVDWLLGESELPTEVFLRAVDIVLTTTKEQVQDNRAFLEQIKRRHHR
jgi:hypothetical protein